jgi:hypothetical protein
MAALVTAIAYQTARWFAGQCPEPYTDLRRSAHVAAIWCGALAPGLLFPSEIA